MFDSSLVEKMNEAYQKRLDHFLKENDIIKDEHGNNYVELAKGLKVRHKKSGLRYTVLGYEEENGVEYILLLKPEIGLDDISQRGFINDEVEDQEYNRNIRRHRKEDIIRVNIKDYDKEYERKG